MIPRIHKTGSSFKGCAAYLLHDKEANTSERVAWIETVNLGTDNPETAWRIMAATAMQQNDLKAAAGIKATGQKPKGTVLHYSLSWKGEEEPEFLTKEAMLRAAKESLSVYGTDPALFKPGAKNIPARKQYADEHQAMIICHTDENHPHVHIMVNRVHPEHGCILPNGKDQQKLSKWANEYEHKTGKILCENRADAWDSRERNIWVKGDRNIPRHSFEMAEEVLSKQANDNTPPSLLKLKAEQKSLNNALARNGGELFKKQRQEWQELTSAHLDRQEAIKQETLNTIKEKKRESSKEYLPLFSELRKRHTVEAETFKSDEESIKGKAGNVWESMRLLAKMRGEDIDSVKFKDVFTPFAGTGARLDLLQKAQAQEKQALEREQDVKLKAAIDEVRATEKHYQKINNERYTQEKADLRLVQDLENAALKTKWKERNEDQRKAYAEYAAKNEQRQDLMTEYEAAAFASYRELFNDGFGAGYSNDNEDSNER